MLQMFGITQERFHGTARDSMAIERLVDLLTRKRSLELPIERFPVELKLNFVGREDQLSFQSLIEAPTYAEGIGIFRAVSAYISTIASRDRLNGGSTDL